MYHALLASIKTPKSWRAAALVFLVCSLFAAGAAPAAPTVVKMATLVPEGSVWDKALKEMGASWKDASGGAVELRIYAGGVAGDEPDVVRKMRIGQIHAAALSVTGLIAIDKSFEIFQIPFFFASWEELYYVLEKMRPELEKRLEAKGYVFLQWGHGGWVHMFSRQPVRSLGDLQKQKIFTWAGNDMMVELWRRADFSPVALAATDILTGLQTGMIDVVPTPPLAALTLQWFRTTPNMLGEGLAPLVGATVISQKTWNSLPADVRTKLLAEAKKTDERLAKEIPLQDQQAIDQMKQRGLTVTTIDAAAKAAWQKTADEMAAGVRANLDDKALLEMALAARAEFRAKK
jgi:TRAP-type C4-dicarboxylate transport system substrate-binding protein